MKIDGHRIGQIEGAWDAVVVGGGPAGGMAAHLLAGRGWRVLLVDRAKFPRNKTCGGCINSQAAALLRRIGLSVLLSKSQPIDRCQLNVRGRRLNVALWGGYAISRAELDAAIAEQAVRRGCVFASETSAHLLPGEIGQPMRQIRLRSGSTETVASARVVLACDGINGTLLDNEPGMDWKIAADSWFGWSATVDTDSPQPGAIEMNVAAGGYVGRVRLADGKTHIGAALDVKKSRSIGGALALVASILSECGKPLPGSCNPQGAGRLTRRRRRMGAWRILAIGDACGYVEPFTGQGIAWALAGAREGAELLPQSPSDWPADMADRWTQQHRLTIGREQVLCRLLRQIAHRPSLAGAAVAIARLAPPLAAMVANALGDSSEIDRIPSVEVVA